MYLRNNKLIGDPRWRFERTASFESDSSSLFLASLVLSFVFCAKCRSILDLSSECCLHMGSSPLRQILSQMKVYDTKEEARYIRNIITIEISQKELKVSVLCQVVIGPSTESGIAITSPYQFVDRGEIFLPPKIKNGQSTNVIPFFDVSFEIAEFRGRSVSLIFHSIHRAQAVVGESVGDERNGWPVLASPKIPIRIKSKISLVGQNDLKWSKFRRRSNPHNPLAQQNGMPPPLFFTK